jgi:hypothetical protein
MGKGFLYPVALEAGWTHLPGRKGFVSGLITSGMGIGPFILGIIANKIMNPYNVKPKPVLISDNVIEFYFPPTVNRNVPLLIQTLSYIFAGIIITGILTITNYPKKSRHSRMKH